MRVFKSILLPLLLIGVVLLNGCVVQYEPEVTTAHMPAQLSTGAYIVVNDNKPQFKDDEITDQSYEYYSELDALNRCGYAMACIGQDIMPTQERGSIGQIKPTGWHTVKYDCVDGKYLYNRCHLIGYQLTGENANERNLITGTRYLNVEGMLPFEDMVADFVKETGYHVMYRVIPDFQGDELVARGVQMEAWSVEDNGAGICFNIYAYNRQPGVTIDYTDGSSTGTQTQESAKQGPYVVNVKSKKFHCNDCNQADSISAQNRLDSEEDRQTLIDQGYEPAGCCKP